MLEPRVGHDPQLPVAAAAAPWSPGTSVEVGCIRDDATLPLMVRAKKPLNLLDWATDNRSLLEPALLKAGAILFRNFAAMTVEDFERLVQSISGPLLEYSYRSTPRTQITGKVYSSTEYPPHQSIPLHNENAYSRSWPRQLWFFSVQAAEHGGETPIADSRQVYREIPADVRECFERKGLMYVRNYGHGLDLSWPEVFQTEDRFEVEAFCRRAGIEFEWLEAQRLRTRQRCQVIERHPVTGETVWFNQAHLFHVSRLPEEVRDYLISIHGEENIPRNVYHADGSPIDPAMLNAISEIYARRAVAFPWQTGDVMVVDNLLAAHGRQPFRGARRVVVAMT